MKDKQESVVLIDVHCHTIVTESGFKYVMMVDVWRNYGTRRRQYLPTHLSLQRVYKAVQKWATVPEPEFYSAKSLPM